MKTSSFLFAIGVALFAQAERAEDFPRFNRLADGVFVYEQADPTKRGVTVNNLVVVTTDGVVVADGQGTVDNTRALVAAIATVTTQPVRYVVVGSIHGDHRGGDKGFPEGVTFITDKQTLQLGGREIQVLMLGRAHTGTDLEVYLPRERYLYMSEVFSNRVFPSMANGFPSEWVAALTKAESLAANLYVPAHGAIDVSHQWTREGVQTYRTAIERVIAEGRRLHDAKVPPDDAPAAANWGELAGWIRRPENAAAALKRVYGELDHAF